jgi:hypothetical protein
MPLAAWWHHARSRVLRRIAPALAVFFFTGAVWHAMLATAPCPSDTACYWAAVRGTVTAVVVMPLLAWGFKALTLVPTKEESDRLRREAEASARAALAAAASERDLRRTAESVQSQLRRTVTDLRDQLELYRRDRQNDDAYYALKRGFHEVANGAARLPYGPG